MGCCLSRDGSGSHNNPYAPSDQANAAPDSSSRNITAASPRGSHGDDMGPSHSSVAPNKRLKPLDYNRRVDLPQDLTSPLSSPSHRMHIPPLSDTNPTPGWTRNRLEKERNDWWDTRTSGSPEIWRAYRLMVEHLQRGDLQSAQTLLDATGCTCPTGELWRTIYDESGMSYKVKNDLWIIFEPNGLVEEDEEEDDEDDLKKERVQELESGSQVTSQEKGKGKAVDLVQAKCRLSSNGRDVVVEMYKGERVASVVGKIKEASGLEDKRLRISYLGHLYSDNDTLSKWRPGHVLNVLVFDEA